VSNRKGKKVNQSQGTRDASLIREMPNGESTPHRTPKCQIRYQSYRSFGPWKFPPDDGNSRRSDDTNYLNQQKLFGQSKPQRLTSTGLALNDFLSARSVDNQHSDTSALNFFPSLESAKNSLDVFIKAS
jgi:hypothetical protein